MINKKKYIIHLLELTGRENIKQLIQWMDDNDYFESPGSTRYHGNYKGGLMEHSLNVYYTFNENIGRYKLNVPKDSIIIIALLHDLCKVKQYTFQGDKIVWNSNNPKGHARLSLARISMFIQLTKLESDCIRYHMGMYGSKEMWPTKPEYGEYTLQSLQEAFSNRIIKLFHYCDDLTSQFVDETK